MAVSQGLHNGGLALFSLHARLTQIADRGQPGQHLEWFWPNHVVDVLQHLIHGVLGSARCMEGFVIV